MTDVANSPSGMGPLLTPCTQMSPIEVKISVPSRISELSGFGETLVVVLLA